MLEYINQSLINSWMLCPERVRREWFEGDRIPPGIAAKIGTGVHKGAEVNHKAKMITRKDEPFDVIQDAARDGYVKSLESGVFFPPGEISSAKKQLSKGLDVSVALAKLYSESLAPNILPLSVEKTIFLEHDEITIPLRGTIDVLTEDNWLPDLKTSAKKWPQSKADTSVQATLYNELVKKETGAYPKKISFEIFTKTKTPAHQSIETTRTKDDFKLLILRIKIMMQQITAGIFPPADPSSWACSPKWCGFYATCKYISKHRR